MRLQIPVFKSLTLLIHELLALSKLNALAGDKLDFAEMMISVFDFQHFLLFSQCFQKLSLPGLWKLCVVKSLTKRENFYDLTYLFYIDWQNSSNNLF